jgi:hypothetical protein
LSVAVVTLIVCACLVGLAAPAAHAAAGPVALVAWGDMGTKQQGVPTGLSDVTAISAGGDFGLVLETGGTVIAWGGDGQDTGFVPPGLTDVTAISAAADYSVVLKANGTVVAWGTDERGQVDVPAGLANVTAISAGDHHSLAVRSDGTVTGWGDNSDGGLDVPPGLGNVVAVEAGSGQSMALRSDGTAAAWGANTYGQGTVPAGLANVTAISAGYGFDLALKSDGTVVAWGRDDTGQTAVPAGLNHVVAISAGWGSSLALKDDGTVVAWGRLYPTYQGGFPMTPPAGLDHVAAIAAGGSDSIALVSGAATPLTTVSCDWLPCSPGVDYRGAQLDLIPHATAGSPVTRTVYTLDGTDPATSPTAVTYNRTGLTVTSSATLKFASIDQAGHAEPTRSLFIGAVQDTVPPVTAVHCDAAPCGTVAYPKPVSVSLTATDTGGSGVVKTVYTTDGSDPRSSSTAKTYNYAFTISQSTTVKAYSIDAAGNIEPVQSVFIQVAALGPAYTSVVDGRDSLLDHWRLGEGSGKAHDTTGRYEGTFIGTTGGAQGAVANDPDPAVSFNGSTSKVSLPSLGTVGDFTIEGWTYLTTCSTANNTLYGTSGAVRILVRCPPSTRTTAYAGVWLNGTEYVLQPYGGSSNLHTWVHWVLTRQGSVLTLYRNGVQIAQRSDLPASALATLNGYIGMQANGNYPLTGRIDEIAVYASPLSATDVADDYQAALSGAPPPPLTAYKTAVLGESSLVTYWRLGERSGTTAADSKTAHTGVYSGVTLGSSGALTFDPDTSASFNGSTSKVSVPSLGTAGDFTIEGWTRLTNSSTLNNTLYGSLGGVRLLIRPGTTNAAYAGVWLNGAEYVLQPNSPFSNLNNWVHWALVRKGSTLSLYRNWQQIAQRTDLPATALATLTGTIGMQSNGNYPLTGGIDDVAVYASALRGTTIVRHYFAAENGPAPS